MDLGLFTLNFGNIARYFNKKNIVLIIFLGIAGNHSSAQIYNPKPEIRDVKIKGILFDKTKIAFSIIPDFSFPMNIRYILGKYNLHSYSKLGFEGGVNIIKDIGDKFGLQSIPPSKCMLSTALLEQVNPQNSRDNIFRERGHQISTSTDYSGVRVLLSY